MIPPFPVHDYTFCSLLYNTPLPFLFISYFVESSFLYGGLFFAVHVRQQGITKSWGKCLKGGFFFSFSFSGGTFYFFSFMGKLSIGGNLEYNNTALSISYKLGW